MLSKSAAAASPCDKGDWRSAIAGVLQGLTTLPGYAYFHEPVDPVKLGVAVYPYVIRRPVDLGTIEVRPATSTCMAAPDGPTLLQDRLRANRYPSLDDVARDVMRCFNNALLFNGPSTSRSPVYGAARDLRGRFTRAFSKTFRKPPPDVGFRLIPTPEGTYYDPIENVPVDDYACTRLQFLLFRLKCNYADELAPFLYYVDPDSCPDYYEVIDEPIALAVIENKLDLGAYPRVVDFANEVRQIWRNCAAFNDSDSALSRQAVMLSARFEVYLAKVLMDLQCRPSSSNVSTRPSCAKRSRAATLAGIDVVDLTGDQLDDHSATSSGSVARSDRSVASPSVAACPTIASHLLDGKPRTTPSSKAAACPGAGSYPVPSRQSSALAVLLCAQRDDGTSAFVVNRLHVPTPSAVCRAGARIATASP